MIVVVVVVGVNYDYDNLKMYCRDGRTLHQIPSTQYTLLRRAFQRSRRYLKCLRSVRDQETNEDL